jgi:KTSC domain
MSGTSIPYLLYPTGAGTASSTGGYRSYLAFWIGGASSIAPNTSGGEVSFLAFWMGGASGTPYVPNFPETGGRQWQQPVYKKPKTVSVSSSNLDTITYDPRDHSMNVTFKSGRTYEYSNVDEKRFKGIQRAKSAGSYFHNKIRNAHFVTRVK